MDLSLTIIFLLILAMVIGIMLSLDRRVMGDRVQEPVDDEGTSDPFPSANENPLKQNKTFPTVDKALVKKTTALAKGGEAFAQCLLGKMYQNGIGVAPDSKQAIYWYERASLQGHSEAQYLLAQCKLKNSDQALGNRGTEYLLRLSAAGGKPEAQVKLAKILASPERRMEEKSESRRWLEKAAQQGHSEARRMLEKDRKDIKHPRADKK